jgi:hypothetical protein
MMVDTWKIPCRQALLLSLALASLCWGGSPMALDWTMGGDFTMSDHSGDPGDDLLAILGNENTWVMHLHGVEYDCWETTCGYPYIDYFKITWLLADQFEFEFFGPDAALLNEVVASQFTTGGAGGAYLEVWGDITCPYPLMVGWMHVFPDDYSNGITMEVTFSHNLDIFPLDAQGCPIIGPFELAAEGSVFFDSRGGNEGSLFSTGPDSLWLTDLLTQVPESPPLPSTWSALKVRY